MAVKAGRLFPLRFSHIVIFTFRAGGRGVWLLNLPAYSCVYGSERILA